MVAAGHAFIPSLISTCFDRTRAWVYVWVSKRWRVVYVGQTNEAVGTLGRAASHLGEEGTFRRCFIATTNAAVEQASDLVLLSFALPTESRYRSLESAYREAVEYNVQWGLQRLRARLNPSFRVISTVRYFPQAEDPTVMRVSDAIVMGFEAAYPNLPALP